MWIRIIKIMDRRRRKAPGAIPCHLTGMARMLDKGMVKADVPTSDRGRFIDWTVNELWKTYKEERMNRRIIIESEIRQLGLRFPNGTVNKDYNHFFKLPVEKISNIVLEGVEDLGLTLAVAEDGNCSLHGRPNKGGDFTLTLRYNTEEGEPSSEQRIPIAFNPDPRSLWRNIPTNPDIMYYKPDTEAAYIKVEAGVDGSPKKDMVAASQRGRSHAQDGKPRDDHFSLFHCDDSDWYVMAVADGAGSAKFSRKGSEVACKTVIDHCRNRLFHNPEFEKAICEYEADKDNTDKRTDVTRHVIDIIFNGARNAHEAVKRVAETNEGTKLKDYATTLMFAICKKFDFGWFIASFWVGDGAMCIFDKESKTIKLLGTPDEGEFSGQTRFLTMPEIFKDTDMVAKRLRMAVVRDFTALFLMTDGVSDPMFETDRNLNDYSHWEEFYNRLLTGFPEDGIKGMNLTDDNEAAKDQLLAWLDFWSPGNHDDRTIAILY